MGIVFAILLGVAAKVFAVEVDERPAGTRVTCRALTAAAAASRAVTVWLLQSEGRAPVNGCPVGGAAAAEKIAKVLALRLLPATVRLHTFTATAAATQRTRQTTRVCRTATLQCGSKRPEGLPFGCMGLGSCVKACAFDAIHIVDGVAKVDTDKCVACGKCVSTCPKKIINLVSEGSRRFTLTA